MPGLTSWVVITLISASQFWMTSVPASVIGAVAPERGSAGTASGSPSRATCIMKPPYLRSRRSGLMPQVIIEMKGRSRRASADPATCSAMAMTSRMPSAVYTPPITCFEVWQSPAKNRFTSTASTGRSFGYVGRSTK